MDPLELFDHLVVFRSNEVRSSHGCHSVLELMDSIIEDLNTALRDRATSVSHIELPIDRECLNAIGIRLSGQASSSIITRGPQSGSAAGEAFRQFWSEKSQLRRIDGDLYECVVWSDKVNVCKQVVDFVLQSRHKLSRGSFAQWSWNQISPDRLNAILSFNPNAGITPTSVATSLRLIRAMDKLRGLLRGLNDKLPLDVTGVLPISSAFRDTAVFPPVVSVPSSTNRYRNDKLTSRTDGEKTPVFPLYVVVTLEQSGKWPDELVPFLHMKRLMVIRIHELLSPLGIPSHPTTDNMLDIFLDGLVFRISVAQPRELRLLQRTTVPEVCEKSGIKRSASSAFPSEGPSLDTPASLAWARLNQSMPTISGMLAAVARSEAHVFPIVCRLAKRWLSAHGYPVVLCPFEAEFDGVRDLRCDVAISCSNSEGDDVVHCKQQTFSTVPSAADCAGRLSEIAVELLVLYAAGFSIPVERRSGITEGMSSAVWPARVASGSPVAAFLRFLRLLATHDWEQKPLLIDLNEGFADVKKRRAALACFESGRERLPAMVLCTPLDPSGSEWTALGPTRAGLRRLQQLAAHSRSLLRAMLVAGAKLRELKSVFRPAQKSFDVVMTLKPDVIRLRSTESIDFNAGRFRVIRNTQNTSRSILWNAEDNLPTEIPPPGARFWPPCYCYDPLNWLARLMQIRLGRYCEVLWDRYGGSWIGLRWRQTVLDDTVAQPKRIFNRASLDGLVVHKPSTDGSRMIVIHKLPRLMHLLPAVVADFVENVNVVHTSHDGGKKKKPLVKS
ncbi:Nucleolar protein 6 [Fasciola hepatica]|uniref:Nucleolar protein 6 n=1 Tax=Fasciola hepatica TaxID=6192 RepID=A0A4E0S1W0_FASHE|nr:Nucleolar protein 6 [Fasciola hepatica]